MNHYRDIEAWVVKKGWWVKVSGMKKYQKVKDIFDYDKTRERKFIFEPLGDFNNVETISVPLYKTMSCKYKKAFYENTGDTYPQFRL